jgi:hypothetical protein
MKITSDVPKHYTKFTLGPTKDWWNKSRIEQSLFFGLEHHFEDMSHSFWLPLAVGQWGSHTGWRLHLCGDTSWSEQFNEWHPRVLFTKNGLDKISGTTQALFFLPKGRSMYGVVGLPVE